MLVKAAHTAGLRNLLDYFGDGVADVTMFVDPGEVAVVVGYTFTARVAEELVWSETHNMPATTHNTAVELDSRA